MMTRSAVRRIGAMGLAVALAAPAGCDRIGNPLEVIGGGVPEPDEFQVMARKPLSMPESYTLPEPTLGAPSPLDPDPRRQALEALIGASGKPVTGAAATPSTGEQVLLSSANASQASREIRVQLEEERTSREENQPYEPPTVLDLLGFGGSDEEGVDETQLVDPVAEAKRLQRDGVVTPVDPDAAAEVEPGPRGPTEPITPYGRPGSPIKHEGTGPKF